MCSGSDRVIRVNPRLILCVAITWPQIYADEHGSEYVWVLICVISVYLWLMICPNSAIIGGPLGSDEADHRRAVEVYFANLFSPRRSGGPRACAPQDSRHFCS